MKDEPEPDAALREAAERSYRFLASLPGRRASPTESAIQALDALDGPVPVSGSTPADVIRRLDEIGSPATMASAGGRYFGFVIGGATPTALAANWLAGAWNQNAALYATSPVGARLEEIALHWIRELLGLPEGSEGAFLSGATMANFTALAAARHAVLAAEGWDVEEQGLAGAPPITVIVGDEIHATALKAIAMLGLGRGRVKRVPVDAEGRIRADSLPRLNGPSIVCVQAGNVNGGGCDPVREIVPRVKESGAWVHVDGAFGLWAAVAPARRHLTDGYALADSWATDGHKWLNVPYDSGIVFVRNPEHLEAAMSMGPTSYLVQSGRREPSHFAPELSRRARGIDAWAAISALGREGLAEMVERTCQCATRFAEGLRKAGYEVLNQVDLNQVVVAFGDDPTTNRVVSGVQADGTCWCGGTRWHGRSAMRISVSSWATTPEDVDQSLAAILRIADQERRSPSGAKRR